MGRVHGHIVTGAQGADDRAGNLPLDTDNFWRWRGFGDQYHGVRERVRLQRLGATRGSSQGEEAHRGNPEHVDLRMGEESTIRATDKMALTGP